MNKHQLKFSQLTDQQRDREKLISSYLKAPTAERLEAARRGQLNWLQHKAITQATRELISHQGKEFLDLALQSTNWMVDIAIKEDIRSYLEDSTVMNLASSVDLILRPVYLSLINSGETDFWSQYGY